MLKQNTTLAAQYPLRLRAGAGAAQMRSMWGRTDRVNQYASEGITDSRAAVPNGHLAPSAWVLPQVAGGMSSRNEARASLAASGNGAQGINLVGNSLLVLTTSGDAAAVASLSGSASLSLSTNGVITAPVSMVGNATISISASGSLGGIASIVGSSIVVLTTSLTTKANGFMLAVPISQDLTTDAIASAVLSAMNSTPPSVNIKQVNDIDVGGTGTELDPWNPV